MTRPVTQSLERQAYAACALTAVTVVVCAVLMTAVALAPAPAAVLPLAVVICVGCPLAMAWSLPHSIAVIRATRAGAGEGREAIKALRGQLARLPETKHPLDR